MEITRDHCVQARRDLLDRRVEAMTERAAPPWQRSPEGEARIPGQGYRVFVRDAEGGLPIVSVALLLEDQGWPVARSVALAVQHGCAQGLLVAADRD